MRERLLFAASAVARLVLVVVAFGLAVGSIGLSAARGFCPEVGGGPLATPQVLAAGPAPLAAGAVATTVDTTETDGNGEEEAPPTDGACPDGQQRCLPPLWSSILILGEPACHDQAPARLRGTLVPAFVGSTILLAAAWWLRPTRLHAEHATDEA